MRRDFNGHATDNYSTTRNNNSRNLQELTEQNSDLPEEATRGIFGILKRFLRLGESRQSRNEEITIRKDNVRGIVSVRHTQDLEDYYVIDECRIISKHNDWDM